MRLSAQIDEHREVAELRWDGAIELIRVKLPESDNDAMSKLKTDYRNNEK